MNEFIPVLSSMDRIGAVGVLILVSLLVITRKLVWYTDLRKVERERDRWQKVAIDALVGPAQAGVKAAEVAVNVVSALPDPAREETV